MASPSNCVCFIQDLQSKRQSQRICFQSLQNVLHAHFLVFRSIKSPGIDTNQSKKLKKRTNLLYYDHFDIDDMYLLVDS